MVQYSWYCFQTASTNTKRKLASDCQRGSHLVFKTLFYTKQRIKRQKVHARVHSAQDELKIFNTI